MIDFSELRYGMFVHFGLYCQLGRGEWAMNRERIPRDEYRRLALEFNPSRFNADTICKLAAECGMKYIVFTTMHHDGFCLYHSNLKDFHIGNTPYARDIVSEVQTSALKYGLKIALYHSLNDWMELPDGADALEDPAARDLFVSKAHGRLAELVEKFKPFDILWYDGWWPFNANDWNAEQMNALVRSIHPPLLVNGRNGLVGDFGTPEQHMTAPDPWRPWEACITLNDSWGYHSGDHNWKSPYQVLKLLTQAAAGRGNLLLNIGLHGDGTIPQPTRRILKVIGKWLKQNGEAIYDTDVFMYGFEKRTNHRSDWCHSGSYTAKGKCLFHVLFRSTGSALTLAGIEVQVQKATILGGEGELPFRQEYDRIILDGLPSPRPDGLPWVIRMECEKAPSVYLTGGMRVPRVPHSPYDPCPSDIRE